MADDNENNVDMPAPPAMDTPAPPTNPPNSVEVPAGTGTVLRDGPGAAPQGKFDLGTLTAPEGTNGGVSVSLPSAQIGAFNGAPSAQASMGSVTATFGDRRNVDVQVGAPEARLGVTQTKEGATEIGAQTNAASVTATYNGDNVLAKAGLSLGPGGALRFYGGEKCGLGVDAMGVTADLAAKQSCGSLLQRMVDLTRPR